MSKPIPVGVLSQHTTYKPTKLPDDQTGITVTFIKDCYDVVSIKKGTIASFIYSQNHGGFLFHSFNDLPAVILLSGTKLWCKHDKLHREDGPAIEYPDGTKQWLLNHRFFKTEEEYWQTVLDQSGHGC